jgi:hypothetical protein
MVFSKIDFIKPEYYTSSSNVMAELITFMQVLGNLLLAAVILSALVFTTFYYVLGYLLKELKLTPLLKKGVLLRRNSIHSGRA